MGDNINSNLPAEALQWSTKDIERECGVNIRTAQRRLRDCGFDGRTFTTAQVLQALSGRDKAALECELLEERIIEQRLINSQRSGKLVDSDRLRTGLTALFSAFGAIIKSSSLPEDSKHAMQDEMARLTDVLRQAAEESQSLVGIETKLLPSETT